MASELTGFGRFCKWIVVPAFVFVLGRYAVGPRIGGLGAKIPQVKRLGQFVQKVKGTDSLPADPRISGVGAPKRAPRPLEETGATEFQRIREEGRTQNAPAPDAAVDGGSSSADAPTPRTKPKPRPAGPSASVQRTPIDQVGNE